MAKLDKKFEIIDHKLEAETIEVDGHTLPNENEFHESIKRYKFEEWVKANSDLKIVHESFNGEYQQSESTLTIDEYYLSDEFYPDLYQFLLETAKRFKQPTEYYSKSLNHAFV